MSNYPEDWPQIAASIKEGDLVMDDAHRLELVEALRVVCGDSLRDLPGFAKRRLVTVLTGQEAPVTLCNGDPLHNAAFILQESPPDPPGDQDDEILAEQRRADRRALRGRLDWMF